MMKQVGNKTLQLSALVTVGVISGAEDCLAGNKNFTSIAEEIINSISGLPGLISGVAYLLGILLGVLGILKIKDHVENPTQTPLQHGAIRLVAGGGLFALPIVYEAMKNTVGADSAGVSVPQLEAVTSGIKY